MNEMMKIIKSRRSCRSFLEKQVSDEELDLVLEAGIYAPSGKNAQSPICIAVQDPEVLKELSKINTEIWGKGPDGFFSAPTVIAVLADPNLCHTYQLDAMACVENMLLMAESLGLGAACISRAKDEFVSEYGQNLLKKLGIPSTYIGVEHVILGYPRGDVSQEKPRRENRIYKI